jgi:hypothetical protein
MNMD